MFACQKYFILYKQFKRSFQYTDNFKDVTATKI